MMSLKSRVAPTTRRATSAMQQRTTTDHAAMLTRVTTAQATAWWIATVMAHVIKTK